MQIADGRGTGVSSREGGEMIMEEKQSTRGTRRIIRPEAGDSRGV
jgi:hypothetical protein